MKRNSFKENWIDNWKTAKSIKDSIMNAFDTREEKWDESLGKWYVELEDSGLSELCELISNNIWYLYFLNFYKDKKISGEHWIDFESEIRYIIQKIDENADSLNDEISEIFKKLGENDPSIAFSN